MGKELIIPMRPKSRSALERGDKIMTTRGKTLGSSGDTFSGAGVEHVILGTFDMRVQDIMDWFYDMEGFDSKEAFLKEWMAIMWGKWQPEKVKICHVFVPVRTPFLVRRLIRETILARLQYIEYKPLERNI